MSPNCRTNCRNSDAASARSALRNSPLRTPVSSEKPAFCAACVSIVTICLLARSAAAQDVPAAIDSQADLTQSLQFEIDRELQSALETAAAQLQRGEPALAIPQLQQVLDRDRGQLVLIEGVYRSAAAKANRLLAGLAPSQRQQYERHSGNAAATALAAARAADDRQALRQITVQYRHTNAGADALRDIAYGALDTAQFADADAAFSELVGQDPEPANVIRRRPQDLIAWCAARLHAGDAIGAADLRRRYSELLAADSVSRLNDLLGPTDPPQSTESAPLADWLPSLNAARWRTELVTDDDRRSGMESIVHRLADNSVPPFAQISSMAVSDFLIVRTLQGLICFDLASGDVRWRQSFPGEAPEQVDKPLSPGYDREGERMLHLLLGDAALASLTSDGERVYRIRPASTAGPSGSAQSATPEPGNELIALSVSTGEVVWTASGVEPVESTVGEDGEPSAQPLRFRGPPTPFGSQLLVVTEQSSSVALQFLDAATGKPVDRIPLCTADLSHGPDHRRLKQSARVVVVDGVAISPTGGGAVVAVDLGSRRVLWGFRYPRESMPAAGPDNPPPSFVPPVLSATGWRDTHLAVADGRVIMASSESDTLYALDARSGDVLWSRGRDEGLYLAGIDDDQVVVAETHAITSYSLQDGAPLWRVPTSRSIAGRGFFTQGRYVAPLAEGGVIAVELADGRATESQPAGVPAVAVAPRNSPAEHSLMPVNLARIGSQIVAVSPASVSALSPLADATAATLQRHADDPSDDGATLEAVSLLIEQGELRAAAELLHFSPPETGSDAWEAWRLCAFEAGLRLLATDGSAAPSESLDDLATSDTDRLRLQWARFAATPDEDHAELIRHAGELFDLHAEEFAIDLDGRTRQVRLDRAIQARLISVRGQLDDRERAGFDQLLLAGIELRMRDQGELARSRLADLLDHLPAGADLLLGSEHRWSSSSEYAQSQLRLLQAADLFPPEIAAAALLQLARLYEAHSDAVDAAATYQLLTDDYADVVLPDGQSVAATLSTRPSAVQIAEQVDDWPLTRPVITSRSAAEGDLYFLPVSIAADRGGLFDRLNVAVHRNGRPLQEFPQLYEGTVRFSGAGYSRPWAVVLPASNSDMRSAQVFPELRRAWGFGQFLVLQVGGELFGIAPFNAAGEPSASVVWPRNGDSVRTTASGGAAPVLESTAQTEAVHPAEISLGPSRVDEFGHLVGSVATVQPGYTAVQQDGNLVAFDTATGQELWRRSGLSPGVRCFGDARHIVVLASDGRRIEVIRALDGAHLRTIDVPFQSHQILAVQGTSALVASVSNPYRLEAVSLLDGSSLWGREFPAGSLAFPVDSELHGLLRPDGTVEFLNWKDGRTVGETTVDLPQPLVHIRCLSDAKRLHLIVSGGRNDPGLESATPAGGIHSNQGYRRLIVNGHWSAIDRESLELLWQSPIDNASIPLDQPADVPLIVWNELRHPADRIGQGSLVGRVRVVDRRTGELIYDEQTAAVHNYFIVERDPDAGWVELRLPDRTVRFDYAAGTPLETD